MTEPLPLYVQDEPLQSPLDVLLTRIAVAISFQCPDTRIVLESFVDSQKAPAYDGPKTSKTPDPIDHYPVELGHIPDTLTYVKQQIVKELFNAIRREDAQAITFLIQQNLVTANTTSNVGQTPLVEAVLKKSTAMVKVVLDLGADCNKFGVMVQPERFLGRAARTPLMVAASLGSLSIVKLLFEAPHSANDALVAPDGQIALRLAAENGHRAIVDYLPSRRAGGYLRFKTHHAGTIAQIKKALRSIAKVIKFFVWDLPKFFVWVIPKHLVVLPVVRSCKWCWKNRKKFGPWCKHQITEFPKRVSRFGKAVWTTAKKVPAAVWRAVKKTPEEIRKLVKSIARAVKEIGKALWEFLTVRVPKATRTALKWTWDGINSLARAISDIFLRFVSFLHTLFEAIVTFLRNVTPRDIWNALCDFLRAVFVSLPKVLWSWIRNFSQASYRFMKALLGVVGEGLWDIAACLIEVVTFVPEKLGIILLSLGSSIAKAFSEIRVWVCPKA